MEGRTPRRNGALTLLHRNLDFDSRYLAISPDGSRAYSAKGGDVQLSNRDPATGLLTSVSLDGGPNRGMVVSPDGLHVYRPSQGDPAVYKHITFDCTPAPAENCLSLLPEDESRLVIKNTTEDKRSLVWKWTHQSGAISDQLGSPATTDNHYALCAYQGSPAPALVSESIAPAATMCGSACWQDFDGSKLVYGDKYPERHGIRSIIVHEGPGTRSQITVKSTGANVPPPLMPVTLPLEVQLQTSDGPCWSAVFTDAHRNTAEFLRATTP